jgi:NitT/TauT family transport system permease protein
MKKMFNSMKYIAANKTLYGSIIVILLWYIMHITVNSSVIPSPYATFKNFTEIFLETLVPHLFVSFLRITSAVLLSLILGSIIGLWIGMNNKADELITPVVYILYPLPKIAFLPVLMILFGLGNTPKILLIVIIIIFQIIISVRDGVKEISKELFFSVMSLGIGRLQIYRHLIIPAVLPKTFTALKISIGVSISVLFFGENFSTTYGVGYFIMNNWIMVNYLEMFSGILALGLMGLLIFKLLDFIEDRLCGWIRIGKG